LNIVGSKRPSLYLSSGKSAAMRRISARFRNPHFGRQAELGVLVCRTARVSPGWQQAAIAAVGTGVKLEAGHAQGVDTKTDCALGVPRLQVENKTLGRLVTLEAPCSVEVCPSRKSRLKYIVRDSMFAVVSSIKPLAWLDPVKPAHRTRAPKPNDWRTVIGGERI
jgi:hypothetical protein